MNLDFEHEIRKHAREAAPKESCGILVKGPQVGEVLSIRCANVAENPEEFFEVNPEEIFPHRQSDSLLAIYHSHVKYPAVFSEADKQGSEVTQLRYYLYSLLDDKFNVYVPVGYRVPLVGRSFAFKIFDCATLVIDYYKEKLNFDMPYFPHDFQSLRLGHKGIRDYLLSCGFFEVTDRENLRPHDIVTMSINGMGTENHAGVITDSMELMHQLINRKSSVCPYFGTSWKKTTVGVFRLA